MLKNTLATTVSPSTPLSLPMFGRRNHTPNPVGIYFDGREDETPPPKDDDDKKPWKPTTEEEKAYCTALANRSYGEGAAKAEGKLEAKVTEANASIAKLTADLALAKSGKDKEGNKLYSEEEVQGLIKKAKDEIQPQLDEARTTAQKYRDAQVRVELTKAISENKGRDVDLISLALKDKLDLDETGSVFVRDEKGNPQLNSEGKKMGVSELVADYLKPRAYLKEGSNLPGNGSGNDNLNPGNPGNALKPDASHDDVVNALAAALSSASNQ